MKSPHYTQYIIIQSLFFKAKTRMPIFITNIQCTTRNSNHQARRGSERYPNRKEEVKLSVVFAHANEQ